MNLCLLLFSFLFRKADIERENLERLNRLASIDKQLSELGDILSTSRNDLFQIQSDIAQKESTENQLKAELHAINQQIGKNQNCLLIMHFLSCFVFQQTVSIV